MKMINLEKLTSDGEFNWLQALLDRSIKESVLLDRASRCFDPAPCPLFETKESEERTNRKLSSLYQKLGGVPKNFLIRNGAQPTEKYDEFTWYAVNEMVSLFRRARASIVKTHSMFVAYWIIANAPDAVQGLFTPEQLAAFVPVVKEDFWNHAETSYIRLASLWDRAGQLLDYVFFNIRQFEHDGFPSVLDRIKTNFAALDAKLDNAAFWKEIKNYSYREQTDGLKWLLRRRNLLVHSLHLGELADRAKEDMDIQYYYNHLEEAIRKKLGTQQPEEELSCLHVHLSSFAKLLEPLCDLCLWGAELIQNMRREKETIIY